MGPLRIEDPSEIMEEDTGKMLVRKELLNALKAQTPRKKAPPKTLGERPRLPLRVEVRNNGVESSFR